MEQLWAAERAITADYVDVKREDARELLLMIRCVLEGSERIPELPKF